jgi:hypothetical protein
MLTPTKLLSGFAAVALAGSAAIASTLPIVHHLRIRLPGGSVEQISYTGNTAPKIFILPVVFSTHMLTPTNFESQFSDLNRTFREIDQMKSVIDRQMAVAMGGREALPLTGPFKLADPALGSIPVSAESYSFVSTLNGNGVCTREVQMTNLGDSMNQLSFRNVLGPVQEGRLQTFRRMTMRNCKRPVRVFLWR